MKGVAAGALRKDGLRHYKEIMLIGNVKKPYCALKDLCQNVPPARDTTPFTPIAITVRLQPEKPTTEIDFMLIIIYTATSRANNVILQRWPTDGHHFWIAWCDSERDYKTITQHCHTEFTTVTAFLVIFPQTL
jgi:hypothetical protein